MAVGTPSIILEPDPSALRLMKFTIKRKELAGETLEIERSAFSGKLLVKQGDKQITPLKEKGRPYELDMKDKSQGRLIIRSRWLDPIPVVMLDNQEILLAEKLRWIDYLFGCFPALMFLVWGPLPTLIAFFMLMANFRILRTKMRPSVKWAAIYALDLLLFWLVVALVKFVQHYS